MKKRILNERLAAIVASIRHGEMLFIADAGSGTCEKALHPLDPSVEYLDLEAVTGSPSFQDIAGTLFEVGDFEAAIVTDVMPEVNPKDYQFVVDLFGEDKVTRMNYIPDYYELRDRCRAVIQTGDYGVHAQAILVAGYPSDDIPMDWLWHGIRRKSE
jgi:D-ribose pyranase